MLLQSSCPHDHVPHPGRTVNLTMWETNRLSPAAVAACNELACVVVPCAANAAWFRASGVTAPLRVVPLGIDPALFRPTTPEPAGLVRFGCAGRTAHGGVRKGLDAAIAAFLDALGDEPTAFLEVKVWPDCAVADPRHPRVLIRRTPLADAELVDWYRSLSCFVSASKGEGWGLQPHQAMAVGRPAIAPFWGGHAAYMTAESCYPVEFAEEPATGPIYGGLGAWCVPRHDSLVEQMRRAFANGAERRAKGAAAAARAAEFTWARTARELAAVLREFNPEARSDHAAT